MNKTIKRVAAGAATLAAAALLVCGLHWADTRAYGQFPGSVSILGPARVVDSTAAASPWTNSLAGASSATNVVRIDTGGAKDCGVQFSFQCAAANTGTITIAFGLSNDGNLTYSNIQRFGTLSAVASGAARVSVCTNYGPANNILGGLRYLYVLDITNGGAASGFLTNYFVSVNLK